LEVKSYIGEEFEIKKMNEVIEKIFIHYQNSIKFDSLSAPIIETLGGLFSAIIILYGFALISSDLSTPGSIYSFMAAFAAAYRPFKSITALNIYFREGMGASQRIFALLDLNIKNRKDNNLNLIQNGVKSIEINHASLIVDDKLIIDNINLKISGSTNIALIGESGSGKTSLANMIAGFLSPTSGQILINSQDINSYSNKSLRENIAYTTQDAKLFTNITIKENISYPHPPHFMDRVVESAKLAMADDFILDLPKKYEHLICPNIARFSSGQVQKISIARIFYKDSSLMIFDEATNSIDYNTEKQIKYNILNNKNKINIFITHRIASAKDFDKIIVMKHGKIIEYGTHEELIRNQGEYFYLLEKTSSSVYTAKT
jgi:subfamily B ATP-binding cassette protein MsbA